MATVNFNESIQSTPATDEAVISELRDRLTEATIKCSERCLYQSAKWLVFKDLPGIQLINSGQQNFWILYQKKTVIHTSSEMPHHPTESYLPVTMIHKRLH
ncbi:hypothetical protein ES702_04612 [subsurface metagenome]